MPRFAKFEHHEYIETLSHGISATDEYESKMDSSDADKESKTTRFLRRPKIKVDKIFSAFVQYAAFCVV